MEERFVSQAVYSHGGFYGCHEYFRLLLSANEETKGRDACKFAVDRKLLLDRLHDEGVSPTYSAVELQNHPSVAALGHVLEDLLHSKKSIFDPALLSICLGMSKSEIKGLSKDNNHLHTPRPLEWDLFISPRYPVSFTIEQEAAGSRLLGTAIAHGGLSDTIWELCGFSAYESARTCGYTPLLWLEKYADVVMMFRLNKGDSLCKVPAVGAARVAHFLSDVWPRLFCGGTASPFSVVLDIKSGHANTRVIATVVADLAAVGVAVAGVGTFTPIQLDNYCSRVACMGKSLSVEAEAYQFFDTAGDVIAQGEAGALPAHRVCMFNAGSLLDPAALRRGEAIVCSKVVRRLRGVTRLRDVELGLYLQEHLVDPAALHVLVECCNSNPDLFAAGLAYGGLNVPASLASRVVVSPAAVSDQTTTGGAKKGLNSGLGLQELKGYSPYGTYCGCSYRLWSTLKGSLSVMLLAFLGYCLMALSPKNSPREKSL